MAKIRTYVISFLIVILSLTGYSVQGDSVIQDILPDIESTYDDTEMNKWHHTPYNEQINQVDFKMDTVKRTLEVARSGEKGYSAWRINLTLEAGDYTLNCDVTGDGRGEIDIYAFNTNGTPQALLFENIPYDQPRPMTITTHFTVPEGTKYVRLGFNALDTASLIYTIPRIFSGKLTNAQLPPMPVYETKPPNNPINILEQIQQFSLGTGSAQAVKIIDPTTGIATDLDAGAVAKQAKALKNQYGWNFGIPNHPATIGNVTWHADLPKLFLPAKCWIEINSRFSGLHYEKKAYPVLLLNGISILNSSEIYSDGQYHRTLIQLQEALTLQKLTISCRCDSEALNIDLTGLRVIFDDSQLPMAGMKIDALNKGCEIIDLKSYHRSYLSEGLAKTLNMRRKVSDVCRLPEKGLINFSGAQFQMTGDRCLIKGMLHITQRDEDIGLDETGHPRKTWANAWDTPIELHLTGKAKELWLLLAARMVPFTDISAPPATPPRFSSHEVLDVEIQYADGQIDHSYPYSLLDKGFVIQRFIGAYAVPLDKDRELSKVIIHNYFRHGHGATGLVAATLNRNCDYNLIPADVLNPEPYIVKTSTMPTPSPLKITNGNGIMALENSIYKLTVQIADAFQILELTQKINPESPMKLGNGGFEIDFNGNTYSGKDFQVKETSVEKNTVNLYLESKTDELPLNIRLSIHGSENGEILFNATLTNKGTQTIKSMVRFPVLDGLSLGKLEDNWIYFPKYCTLMSNQTTYGFCPGDERAYFVQFYDGYNPKAGYGLALLTHNFDGTVLDYGLFKTPSGLKYFIQYPKEWHPIAPDEEHRLVETALILHTDDWHGALQCYKNWVSTWYTPIKKEKLEWWRNTWVVFGQMLTKAYEWVIPAYDEANGRFIMREQLEAAKRRWGGYTPMTHVWGWNMPPLYPGEAERVSDPNHNYADGEMNPANYRGGADNLRKAFAELQLAGSPVSLYHIPAYLPKASPIGRSKGRELTQVQKDGSLIENDLCWFPCSWAWCDTFVDACVRAQKATGTNAVYVDISPFPRDYTCYSPNHGHTIPLNTNISSRRILKKLRERLPEGVALWHEDPACDIDVQYSNGSMTYYTHRVSEHRAPDYGITTQAQIWTPARQSILRFVFPKYKTFVNPVGLASGEEEMAQYAITFFNGDGVDDTTFQLYDDRSIAVVQKIAGLQKEYSDCFLSSNPQPLIPTLAGHIQANCFPADNGQRTIWTLWNGGFTTFRGAVLEIPSVPGEEWVDIWSGKPVKTSQQDGKTTIYLTLDPQSVGGILRK